MQPTGTRNWIQRLVIRGRALEILEAARTLGAGSPLVFPGKGGKLLASKTLRQPLRRQRVAAVVHGFRSSFRDWAAEETDHPREVVEAALAHVVRNPVEAAYARSDLFERRRRLMTDWAGYLADTHSPPLPIVEPAEHDLAGTAAGSVPNYVQNRLSQTSGHGKRLIDEIDLLTKEYSHDHSQRA